MPPRFVWALAIAPATPQVQAARGRTLRATEMVLVLSVFIVLGITVMFVLLTSVHAVRRNRNRWLRPSWFANPFSEPAQFFHVAGLFATAAGASGLVRYPANDPGFSATAAGLGLGLLCGVHLYVKAFSSYFVDAEVGHST